MRSLKKTKFAYISLLLIEIALYLLADIYFIGHLMILTVVYGAAGALIVRLPQSRIKAQVRSGARQYGKGDEIMMDVTVQAGVAARLLRARVFLEAENILTGQKEVVQTELSGLGKGTDSFRFNLFSPYAGQIEIRIKELTIFDCLGLFCSRTKETDRTEIFVFPSMTGYLTDIDEIEHYDMESFKYSSSQKGDDVSEVFGIRAYEPGDSAKHIHWKLSGKADELLVKELSLPVENRMMIIADKNSLGGKPDPEAADKITELVASLSRAAVMRRIKHKIGWYDCLNSKFEEYRIESEDDLIQVMPAFLSSPHRKDEMTAAERYLQYGADSDTAVYLYVTDSERAEEDAGVLAEYGKVKVCAIQKDK